MRRLIPAILLIAVLVIGGGFIATTAYQLGLATSVTTAIDGGASVVVPATGYGYGYGFHPFGAGFGFFGFLGTLLVLFLVYGLIRAVVFGGRGGRRGPWGGPGAWGPGMGRHEHPDHHGPWATAAHDRFEDWHQRAHAGPTADRPTDTPDSPGSASQR